MAGTSNPETEGESPLSISTKLERIATLAKQSPQMVLTSLAHYIDIDWLKEAYRRTRKNGAPGIDGQTAKDYAANLEDNLQSLLDRAKSGRYRAPAVRRVHIPKGKGATRPIGIPTIEDKILQRAVLMIMDAVYEQDFLDCSFGFRPGRSPHDALDSLRKQVVRMKGCWLLEVDLRSFFDSVDRGHLRAMLNQRVRDGVLIKLIGKWLNAGVVEDGDLRYPQSGTPQGGVISPLLANVVLHEVLDKWFENEVKPRLKGRAFLVRFADDFVMGFAREDDARRVWGVLPKRLGKYGLSIHPEKTRLVDFRKPPSTLPPGSDSGGKGADTFDLLGFTYFWGKSLEGYWVMKRKTSCSRLTRSIKAITDWCKVHRHKSIYYQHKMLCAKLTGHYQYFGVIGNFPSMRLFQRATSRSWRKWLHRRSQRRRMTWKRFKELLKVYPLPDPQKRTESSSA